MGDIAEECWQGSCCEGTLPLRNPFLRADGFLGDTDLERITAEPAFTLDARLAGRETAPRLAARYERASCGIPFGIAPTGTPLRARLTVPQPRTGRRRLRALGAACGRGAVLALDPANAALRDGLSLAVRGARRPPTP